jgi:hypothetical protein
MAETATTSTSSGKFATMKLDILLNMMKDLPEYPKMFGLNWCKIVPSEIIPPNTIFISMDLAKWLENSGIIFLEEQTP